MDPRNANNDNPDDVLLHTDSLQWAPFAPGIDYKVLRLSPADGVWTVLIRMAKGAAFPPHKHLGAGEFYMLSGCIEYRAGSARAGDYGYEPLGVYHENTVATEDNTVILFTNHGPIAFLGEDDSVAMVLDWEFFRDNPDGIPLAAE